MELANLKRVGGCARVINILGLLFGENVEEDVIPVRLRASCTKMLTGMCSIEGCPRYRTGTAGSSRISWDNKGATI